MQHARPHLQTHTRGQGHSAVAGAAYRLGLRLYDQRAGKWHDFRRRKIGEEVVRALTIAPEGAPVWATDPEELWNRVEAAEKRKDAQVARDYRIPIPFGLSDDEAGNMAEEMARFIATQLHTAVSMGLHRDGELDAVGNVKPKEKQGYHAHLYFPTRKVEQLEDTEGSSEWGLGAKFAFLTSRRTSSDFVERINERWAELSNRYTADRGLTADYDHRSYARQGLPLTPQPTLGAAVVAMERKGFFTRKGDALRGDIIVPSKIYEIAHAIVLDAQHKQAVVDFGRESAATTLGETKPSAMVMESSDESEEADTSASPTVNPSIHVATLGLMLPERQPGSLLTRFRQAVSVPAEPEALYVFARVLRFIRTIERVLDALANLAQRFQKQQEGRDRRMAAKLDTAYELDESRAQRSAAQQRLDDWEVAHPWKMWAARTGGGEEGKPAEWRVLRQEAEAQGRRVQDLKATVRRHQQQLDVADQAMAELKVEEAGHTQALQRGLADIEALNPTLAETLIAVMDPAERASAGIRAPRPSAMPAVLPSVAPPEEPAVPLRVQARPRIS